MPSPFPGMNPYLEQKDVWEDFHHEFIARARENLAKVVGPHYLVKVEVRLFLHEIPGQVRELERHANLEIRDCNNRDSVTTIELLSPINGQDRVDYLATRSTVHGDKASYVEIDFNRALPFSGYYVMVSRCSDRPQVVDWSIGLRDPLPIIPIPLKAPDPDVTLDLQAVLNQVYDAADYGKYIYQGTPEPPLAEADQIWANQFVPPRTA